MNGHHRTDLDQESQRVLSNPELKMAATNTSLSCHDKMNQLRHRLADKIRLKHVAPLLRNSLQEAVGTMILVIYGCGVLAQVMLGDGNHGDFMSIALGWGMAVSMGVYFAGAGGGPGLINPAVTLAFGLIGKIRLDYVPIYTLAQVLGAFVGAVQVYLMYYESLLTKAQADGGYFLMNSTGGIFVTQPNPSVSNAAAFVDQIFGTALLTASALAITDKNAWNMPGYLHPFMLGFMVYSLVGAFGMNAGAALNPARDLGPRFAIAIFGWGSAAFTSSNYYFWVPIIGPYIGAVIGAVFYEITIGIHIREWTNPPGKGHKIIDGAAVRSSNLDEKTSMNGGMEQEHLLCESPYTADRHTFQQTRAIQANTSI